MAERATDDQKAYLDHLGASYPGNVSKDEAARLIRRAKAKGKGSHKPKGSIGAGIRAILIFGLLACLGLCLWPRVPAGEGSDGNIADAQIAREKLTRHLRAVQTNVANSDQISERQANAYLQEVVSKNQAQGGTFSRPPELINIDCQDNAIGVFVRTRWFGVPLTYFVKIVPNGDGGQAFAPAATQAHVGHLPMPPFVRQLVVDRVANTFSGMKDEASLWNDLDDMRSEADRVVFRRLP